MPTKKPPFTVVPATPAAPKAPRKRPPNAGIGRPKGTTNKITRLLKEAIVTAAELEGSNGKGKDKLVGWLRTLARNEPRSFATLLGKVIPLQVSGDPDRPFTVIITQEDASVG